MEVPDGLQEDAVAGQGDMKVAVWQRLWRRMWWTE